MPATVLSPWQRLHQDGALLLLSLLLIPLVLLLLAAFGRRRKGGRHRLPPSPPRLPLIGNLHQFVRSPHRSLTALSQKYGPLMLLQLGRVPVAVVSSADVLEELVRTNGAALTSRLETELVRQLYPTTKGAAFSPGGEYWKNLRRLYNVHLLGANRVQSHKNIRGEEVASMIDNIQQYSSSSSGIAVDLREILDDFVINLFSRLINGRRFRDEGLKRVFHVLLEEHVTLISQFNVHDYFPFQRCLSKLTGFNAQVRRVSRKWDYLFDSIFKNHIMSRSAGDKGELAHQETLVDVLLAVLNDPSAELSLAMEDIKPILIELIVAGTTSQAHTLEWAMAELIRSPMVMKRVQAEVRGIAGTTPTMDEADIAQMNYLRAVMKETLRLHPPAVVLLPRQSSQVTRVSGYEIPKQTPVLINAWAIMRDPSFWEAPEEFRPERFLDATVDFRGRDYQFIPFGFDQRICPGLQLATTSMEVALANLLHRLDWELPDGMRGEDLNMEEENYRFPMRKKQSLRLIPTPHLHPSAGNTVATSST